MAFKQIIAQLKTFLSNSEMFARPSKQIVGNWHLVEYYVDEEKELKNITEEKLKNSMQFWNITFSEEKMLSHNMQLNLPLLQNLENGPWSIHKNYICFTQPSDFRKTLEFQFAISSGMLKILKKNSKGEIDFFGFFKKTDKKN